MRGADAARSVHQHHDGKAGLSPCAMRNSPATVTGLPLAIAGEELLVRDGQRRNCVDLDPGGDFLRHRLGVGFDACQPASRCIKSAPPWPPRPARSHLVSPTFVALRRNRLWRGTIDQASGSGCQFASPQVIIMPHPPPALPDAAEMGEAKTGAVFQAVAERAVDADMRQPDHRDRQRQRRFEAESRHHQRHRHQ